MANQFNVIFNQSNERAAKLMAAIEQLTAGSDEWINLMVLHSAEIDRMLSCMRASNQAYSMHYSACGSADLRLETCRN